MQDIDEHSVKEFAEFISNVSDGDSVIIQSMSHGGLVFSGLAIVQLMNLAKERGIEFTAYIYGLSASASAVISLNCNKIYMADGSQVLIHSAYGGTDKGVEIANDEQIKIIHQRLPEYKLDELDQDVWISSAEAVKIGLADGIITNTNNLKLVAFFNKHNCIKGVTMNEEVKEEVVEEVVEEQDDILHADEPKSLEDVVELLVEHLDEIDHRLAVLEGEGKKADDELQAECGEDKESARIKKLYARMMRPANSKPRSVEAKNTTKAELERDLKDFLKRIKISDYIR
jgi:ATP-dependent protease ClpP protease subunit